MRVMTARRLALSVAAVTVVSGAVVMADAGTALAAQQVFVGYGALPSDAHAAAATQMHAYSPTCQEIGTTYSEAGSEHYWKATLTADC
jgi:hypothetical protein